MSAGGIFLLQTRYRRVCLYFPTLGPRLVRLVALEELGAIEFVVDSGTSAVVFDFQGLGSVQGRLRRLLRGGVISNCWSLRHRLRPLAACLPLGILFVAPVWRDLFFLRQIFGGISGTLKIRDFLSVALYFELSLKASTGCS